MACVRHRLVGKADFGFDFASPPAIWARASGGFGWKDTSNFDYNYEVNWARPVCRLIDHEARPIRDLVYDVRNGSNVHIA